MIDKNEMLEVFKEMLNRWEYIAKEYNIVTYELSLCLFGFCHYLEVEVKSAYVASNYLSYLKKDLITTEHKKLYWYPMYYDWLKGFNKLEHDIIVRNQFQPRIDHLKRTIARLEKELKEV